MHRDVKPANVLIARQRGTEAGTHGYLTDFGLTKRSASDSGVTGTGQFVGTLDYAAPEQFRGEDVDPRTDVYSLGCLFFECLAGHPPFRAENDAALMFAHLMEAPPSLTAVRPDLPDDIDEVVATAMAKEPKDRWLSAGAFASRASVTLGHPIDEPSTHRPTPRRPTSRRSQSRRRRRVTIGATAAFVVLLIATLLTLVGGGPARASFRPGISIVDQVTGESLASIPTSRISQPAEVVYGEGSFWIHNLEPNSFAEIDPENGQVLKQIPAPFQDVGSFTVEGDTLWVTGESLAKIDIELEREVDYNFDPDSRTQGVVVADGSLWVAMPLAETTLRLDLGTGEVQRRFPDLPGSVALAFGDGSVWTAGFTAPFGGGFTGTGGVNRIDPSTNEVVTQTPLVLPLDCCPAVAGGGFGWVADPTKGDVYKIDQTGQVVDTYPAGAGASIGSFSDGVVWIGGSDAGTVAGIDAITGARRTFRFEHPVQGVAAGSGALIVTLGPGPIYEEVIDGLDGKVARFFIQSGRLSVPDPAILKYELGFWLEFATCAKLLNYADVARAGWLGPAAGGRLLDARGLVRRPNIHVHGPARLPVLPPVQRTGDGGDLPLLDRAGHRPLTGCRRVRPLRHIRHRRRGRVPPRKGRPYLRPSGDRRHPHHRANRTFGRLPAAPRRSAVLSGANRNADRAGRCERVRGLSSSSGPVGPIGRPLLHRRPPRR